MNYYLAIDIGASSGRHILGWIEDGKIKIEEIHRFKNYIIEKEGKLCWDINYLFTEIKTGMKRCLEVGKLPKSLGIDTWGVDFVLLDNKGEVLGDAVSYRDQRTKGIMEKVIKNVDREKIYRKTGIQFMEFNTIYQLAALNKNIKEKAKDFLMIPDYFNYLLTGIKVNEYTNLTTTQLYNINSDELDDELLEGIQINKKIFPKVGYPMECIGEIKEEIKKEIGYSCEVILPPTHDTGSAFLASIFDLKDKGTILSSGTWSLLGKEIDRPILSKEALKMNFTNEGGAEKRYRFLKNIMGMWIVQRIKGDLEKEYSFDELVTLARKSKNFKSIIDVNDNRFFSGENISFEIKEYCKKTRQKIPNTLGELLICAYRSLAVSYRKRIQDLEQISGEKINSINIVGGGCKNNLLNEMIQEETGLKIFKGPIEATALGNILSQMLSSGEVLNLKEAKKLIRYSINKGGEL